jgi:hypothetical protein
MEKSGIDRFIEILHEKFKDNIIESSPRHVVYDSDETTHKSDEFIFTDPEIRSLGVNWILQGRAVFVDGYKSEDDFFDF